MWSVAHQLRHRSAASHRAWVVRRAVARQHTPVVSPLLRACRLSGSSLSPTHRKSGLPPHPTTAAPLPHRQRRDVLTRGLHVSSGQHGSGVASKRIRIGDVTASVRVPDVAHKVPWMYEPNLHPLLRQASQDDLQVLRWMAQKEALGQDVFLVGPPGPHRRRLAMWYAQVTGQEVEYCSISRDTTDSDLKQRREIVGGSAVYVDQTPVLAAMHGRLLILDGIEKAERNVLPTLNNLLENREMGLPDGRFLVAAERYDALLLDHTQEELDARQLVRVHEDFRVIALGLPVPAYPGFPLDPPLRSRFQARFVDTASISHQLHVMRELAPPQAQNHLRQMLSLSETVRAVVNETPTASSRVHLFPYLALESAARVLGTFPGQTTADDLLHRFYPYKLFGLESPYSDRVDMVIDQLGLRRDIAGGYTVTTRERLDTSRVRLTFTPQPAPTTTSTADPPRDVAGGDDSGPVAGADAASSTDATATTQPAPDFDGAVVSLDVPGGSLDFGLPDGCVLTPQHDVALGGMLQDHALGHDLALIGEKGCGKSMMARVFASTLGYASETIHMYKDMTARDLLQRRTTDSSGNTRWELTPLVEAALSGT